MKTPPFDKLRVVSHAEPPEAGERVIAEGAGHWMGEDAVEKALPKAMW